MNRKAFKTCAATFAAGLGLLGGALPAMGQTPPGGTAPTAVTFPGDWPNLGAFTNRQGRNGNPFAYSSGLTQLRYLLPNTQASRAPIVLDNTDLKANLRSRFTGTSTSVGQPPYDNPANSAFFPDVTSGPNLVQSFVTPLPSAAAWPTPVESTTGNSYLAYGPLTVATRLRDYDTGATPTFPFDPTTRPSPYNYATCVPSAAGQDDPSIPDTASAAGLKKFEWSFAPLPGAQRTYALYAYLPLGPTTFQNGGTGPFVPHYAQTHFVYEILWGPDKNGDGIPDNRIVDVRNTDGINGYVRLGITGSEDSTVFPADGTISQRIVVRLYNTVPRYRHLPATETSENSDRLVLTGSKLGDSTAVEQAAAAARVVYADASTARPETGTFTASPTAATLLGNGVQTTPPVGLITEDTNPATDWDVTVARNNLVTGFVNGQYVVANQGTVYNYEANLFNAAYPGLNALRPPTAPVGPVTPAEKWHYSVLDTNAGTTTVDNGAASVSNSGPQSFVTDTTNTNHIGGDYLAAPVSLSTTTYDATVTYSPSIADGDYDIYAYIPGNGGGETYATNAAYVVNEGAVATSFPLDQTKAQGWVRIGSRRFTNTVDPNSGVSSLSVTLTNYSPGDVAPRKVYADAIRFVGTTNVGISSTPVHVTVSIADPPVPPATTSTTSTLRKVVLVADESGKIHCLDEQGRGDGTTTEYWSYPSTPDSTQGDNYRDPNIFDIVAGTTTADQSGIDGRPNNLIAPILNTPTATMPSGFSLSTAVVAHVGTRDLLYIGSTNGRVYCIDMAGRGDYSVANRTVGTTARQWTYPDDYNPNEPSGPIGKSGLGSFRGSVVYAEPGGVPTIYVPAPQGRVYALNAAGDTNTRTTSVRWAFPTVGHATIPTVNMTPTYFASADLPGGRLFFGTGIDTTNDSGGQFYCLDATTGDAIWDINGEVYSTSAPVSDPHIKSTTVRRLDGDYGNFVATDSVDNRLFAAFTTGPVTVDAATFASVPASGAGGPTTVSPDTVYVLNDNQVLYGLRADDGSLVSGVLSGVTRTLRDDTNNVLSGANLSFTVKRYYSRLGALAASGTGTLDYFPVVTVPTTSGEVIDEYARLEDYNIDGNYQAGGNDLNAYAVAQEATSVAAADNFRFAADAEGGFYAFDDLGSTNSTVGFDSGVSERRSANDPSTRPFRHLHLRLVNVDAYKLLSQINASGTGNLTYAQATSGTYDKPHTQTAGVNNPYAFEWGETAYVLAYGFPYATYNSATPTPGRIAPPAITITLSVAGRSARQFPVDSKQFANPATAPYVADSSGNPILDGSGNNVTDPTGAAYRQDGYAIVAIPFSSAGATALAPGNGRITARLATAALGTGTATSDIAPDTTALDYAVSFIMANPLALNLDPTNLSATIGYNTSGSENSDDTTSQENLRNGTFSTTPRPQLVQLGTYAPAANHGSTTTRRVYVYDRSLMGLLTEDGIGNVRLSRSNMQRQGDFKAVYGGLDPAHYPGFEDTVINRPNANLDYPDVGREQVRASASADGSTANPVLTNIHLALPTVGTTKGGPPISAGAALDAKNTRYLVPTPIDLMIDVPRYQPPVNVAGINDLGAIVGGLDISTDLLDIRHDQTGQPLGSQGTGRDPVQGYFGRVQVFVDSQNDSRLGTNPAEVYRGFNLSTNVNVQRSVLVGSPTVDLGSLASGTGLSPAAPSVGGLFDPWNTNPTSWSRVYQPISVRNDGNVNLSNLRLAMGTNDNGTPTATNTTPWALTTADNDPLAYMTSLISSGGGIVRNSLWTNFDSVFSPPNPNQTNPNLADFNQQILPKPRVTDRVSTELVVNPYPRANPNIKVNRASGALLDPSTPVSTTVIAVNGSNAYRLNRNYPTSVPKVGVSVPLGFPVGNYSSQLRVVEDGFPMSGFTVPANNEVLQFSNRVYEAYSDPITMTFKVRETRMTNRNTPNTAGVLDDPFSILTPFPPALAGTGAGNDNVKASFRNAAPAALRTATGGLIVAWESDRKTGNPDSVTGAVAPGVNPTRIFLGGLRNNAPMTGIQSGATAFDPPLWDLTQFAPPAANSTSWIQKNDTAFPLQSQDQTLLGLPGNVLVNNTVQYGSPTFAARGMRDAFSFQQGGSNTPVYMGFVGDAQIKTDTGRITASKVFLANVTVGNDGAPAITGTPIPTASDSATTKGKPALLEMSDNTAFLFYSETSAGRSSITADRLRSDGSKFANPVSLDFGEGFSSVFSPSVTARYKFRNANVPIIEMSFAGKLRGRSNAEVYLGRLRLGTPATSDPTDGNYAASVTDAGALHLLDSSNRTAEYTKAGSPFIPLPQQSNERLLSEGDGLYRSRGVVWDRSAFLRQIQDTVNFTTSPIVQYLPTNVTAAGLPVATDLLVRTTAQVDRQSGLIVCDSRLGGKAYIDPELGTVRFVGAAPNRNAEIRISYRPTFLRVTPGGTASYSSVNGLFDDRLVAQYDDQHQVVAPYYWFSGAVVPTNPSFGNAPPPTTTGAQLHSDRYFYAYGRGAAGGGVTARPYSTSLRIGLRLPTRIATNGIGQVLGLSVTGNNRPYQADPATGRIYFQAEDEDNAAIRVFYTGVNEATNQPTATIEVDGAPSFVLEKEEAPIAVDEAANDSAVAAFLDPFTFPNEPRPPLTWLFYVSTRGGQPDLYFQTIAPQFLPSAK